MRNEDVSVQNFSCASPADVSDSEYRLATLETCLAAALFRRRSLPWVVTRPKRRSGLKLMQRSSLAVEVP